MLQFHSRIIDLLFPKSNNSTMMFPAIYGTRAIAIIFIVLSALNLPFARGGALGFSILFVISGYLFTESMMKGVEKENRLNLLKFYKNRASKIFPPLVLMVLTYTILLALFRRELLPQMKSEFLPGLLQFENWWHIIKFNPAENPVSPLGFLWALSVMVQLLMIWSLILWCINRFLPDERIYILAPAGLAFISFLLFAILYKQDDPARALYGTDTRAFSFLLGSALACYTGNPRDRIWKYPVFIMDILGGISLVALILMFFFAGSEKIVCVGTNLLASLFTACILLSAFRPSSILARVLGFTPFSMIGRASYGIYLWCVPFILLLRAEQGKWWVMLIAIILTGIAAALSTRFIDAPIRRGIVSDTYRIIDGNPKSTYEKQEYRRALKRARIVLIVAAVLIILSLISLLLVSKAAAPSQEGGEQNTPSEGDEGGNSEGGQGSSTMPSSFEDTNTLFIGDEFAINAHDTLVDNIPNITADIASSRYSTSAGPIYEAYSNGGWEGRLVIISLSHAGELYDSLENIREKMKEDQILFVVNDRGSEWEEANNVKITGFVGLNENTYAIDWYGASENHPEYFDSETGGLSQEGAVIYTELIKMTVEAVLNNNQ